MVKLDHEPADRREAEPRDDDDENALQDSEDELEVGGLLDAELVEARHEPGDGDREDLRPVATEGRGRWRLSQWKAGKTPRVRASPLVTAGN